MPLFLDRHYVEDITWDEVRLAHEQDFKFQAKHDTKILTYWFDEGRHTTFCLVAAPEKEALMALHAEAHGQIPNDIVEVEQKAVMQFMGRIADIPIEESADGREADRGMRSIMFTDLVGYTSMMSRLGDKRAFALLQKHNNVIRDALTKNAGREVKHTGDGIMASFDKADSALRAAIEIRGGVSAISVPGDEGTLSIRIGLTFGEPLQEGGDLFGTSVNLASRLCDLADADEILLDDAFHGELSGAESEHELESIGSVTIRGFEEPVHVRRSVI